MLQVNSRHQRSRHVQDIVMLSIIPFYSQYNFLEYRYYIQNEARVMQKSQIQSKMNPSRIRGCEIFNRRAVDGFQMQILTDGASIVAGAVLEGVADQRAGQKSPEDVEPYDAED